MNDDTARLADAMERLIALLEEQPRTLTLTKTQAAKLYGNISTKTLLGYIREGRIPVNDDGRIPVKALEVFAERGML